MRQKPSRPQPAPEPPPAPARTFDHPAYFLAASAAVLIPCFWQSRLQAGDLSSHIYNTWLAELIRSGKTQGLTIATQTTNVLFDWMLSAMFSWGAGIAQRIAVALSVLVFVWGAFTFISTVAGRRAWNLFPVVAMLAYGWTFHIGFFNFYLSLGLCFFALALSWRWKPQGLAAAVPFLAIAYVAHALPVMWTAALLVYRWIADRAPAPRARAVLTALVVGAIIVVRIGLAAKMQTRWVPQQILLITGADQALVFDSKYWIVFLGWILLWLLLLVSSARAAGSAALAASVPFHLCLITAAGVFLLPTAVLIPGYKHALVYIAERMSLGLAVLICALLASARPSNPVRYLTIALAVLFFGFLYRDERIFNGFEDRMEAAVAPLPPGQRVVSGIDDPSLRADALTHMVDRVCVGRCYSYANYEASTAQFRVRVDGPNPFIAPTYQDSWMMQQGEYVVQKQDLPLYRIDLQPDGQMVARPIPAGKPNGVAVWSTL